MATGEAERRTSKHSRSTENTVSFIKLLTDFRSVVADIPRTHVHYIATRER